MYIPPQYKAMIVSMGPSDIGVSLQGTVIASYATMSEAKTFSKRVNEFLAACSESDGVDLVAMPQALADDIQAILDWTANPPQPETGLGNGTPTSPTPSNEIFVGGGSFTFTVPPLVTTIKIEAWGSGAQAGSLLSNFNGGGGAYSRTNSVAVTPGESLTVEVDAANGHAASFVARGGTTLTLANSGLTGTSSVGGAGGLTAGGVGDVLFAGGSGASVASGAGGGSAGSAANGNNGVNQTGGAAVTDGGAGGAGSIGGTGGAATAPGGGGGGGTLGSGVGAAGKVKISWPA